MEINFRKYTEADKNDCLKIFKSNVPKFFTETEIREFTDFLDKADENTEDSRVMYYVVTLGEKIIGCGGIGCYLKKSEASLCWGLIDRKFHRQGYGGKFLKYRLDKIVKHFPNCAVKIDTTQFSAPFFEKFGFETVKITKDFYAKGMDRYDMILGGFPAELADFRRKQP
jgi:[ribosomal protein S18]-alanine N-acetyltransferase